jgi:lysozyme family protein
MAEPMTPDARFARCDVLVDAFEGGAAFTDNPRDPGRATKHGITLATLTTWRKQACTAADVAALTAAEASTIRRKLYWDKVAGDQLPAGLDLEVYDMAVNMGPGTAARALQTVLDLTPDGAIGTVTLLAVHTHTDLAELIGDLFVRRGALYRCMAGFPVFGTGWMRRAASCANTARAWAARGA